MFDDEDALVRILGYASRDELLQVDVRKQVFSSPEHYRQFAEPMEATGVVRSHEEALRRKDGSTVYVMVNAFAVNDDGSLSSIGSFSSPAGAAGLAAR